MIAKVRSIFAARGEVALAFVAALVATILLQIHGGAYRSEYGGHPDEAAHFVTGLMIRDYVANGLPQSPMVFAKGYYDHYPKVALGNWPPVFYVIQAAWTLVFSPSRISILLLMAVLTALVTTVLFRLLREDFARDQASFGVCLFLALPLVRQHAGMVMTEIPIALFTLLAVVSFGRYLDRERTADSLWFGLFASVAIMTKGSGLMLALVPPLVVAFTGKWQLLRRANFWYAVPIVLVLCGPWTWKFRDIARAGWMEDNPSWHFTQQALVYYPWKLLVASGFLGLPLALLGFTSQLRRKNLSGIWAASGALLAGGLFFHTLVPCGLEPRHLIPLLAPLIFCAIGGWKAVQQRFSPGQPAASGAVYHISWLFPLLLIFVGSAKNHTGFSQAAEAVLSRPDAAKAVLFVSSDARGEGQFISEIAVREPRPGHIVRRASKVLASSTWGGQNYQSKAEDETALVELLVKERIEFLVLDATIPDERLTAHHKLLRSAMAMFPQRFSLVGKFPATRDEVKNAEGVTVFRLLL